MQAQLNKKATTTRLTNEGRFDEFKEVRENFRRKGYVGDACWIHALEEKDRKGRPFGQSLNIPAGVTLPPSGSANYASPSQAAGDESPMPEPPEAEAFRNKGKAQYADAVNWVATNLHLKNVNEAEAPNGIAVNLRRDAIAHLKDALKKGDIPEDDERKAQDDVQKLTDKYITEVDKMLAAKEAELMQV